MLFESRASSNETPSTRIRINTAKLESHGDSKSHCDSNNIVDGFLICLESPCQMSGDVAVSAVHDLTRFVTSHTKRFLWLSNTASRGPDRGRLSGLRMRALVFRLAQRSGCDAA